MEQAKTTWSDQEQETSKKKARSNKQKTTWDDLQQEMTWKNLQQARNNLKVLTTSKKQFEMTDRGFNSYHKIAKHDHVLAPKFWHT